MCIGCFGQLWKTQLSEAAGLAETRSSFLAQREGSKSIPCALGRHSRAARVKRPFT